MFNACFPISFKTDFLLQWKKIYLKLYPGATGDSESSSLNNTTQPRKGLKNHGASLATYWTAANVKIILWFKRPHRMGPLKLSDHVIQTIQTGGKWRTGTCWTRQPNYIFPVPVRHLSPVWWFCTASLSCKEPTQILLLFTLQITFTHT